MKILFVGDIMGRPGRDMLKAHLPQLIKEENIDFTVVNAENAAGGRGITLDKADELFDAGADVLTMGNVDPAGTLRHGTPEKVREDTLAVMEACCSYPNFLISSGCDIPPATPWENLDAFFAAVEEFYNR